MSGKDAIIEKIESDARAIMIGISEEADKKGQEILRVANNDARIYSEQQLSESTAEREEIIRRRITVANLEVKKMLLAARRDIMEQTFREAADAVRADREGYEKMLLGMLACADDGDEITFSEKDKELASDKWFASAVRKVGKMLTKNPEYGSFSGGILIKGAQSDKNFTLEVELGEVRDNYEPQIAALLFGE